MPALLLSQYESQHLIIQTRNILFYSELFSNCQEGVPLPALLLSQYEAQHLIIHTRNILFYSEFFFRKEDGLKGVNVKFYVILRLPPGLH